MKSYLTAAWLPQGLQSTRSDFLGRDFFSEALKGTEVRSPFEKTPESVWFCLPLGREEREQDNRIVQENNGQAPSQRLGGFLYNRRAGLDGLAVGC